MTPRILGTSRPLLFLASLGFAALAHAQVTVNFSTADEGVDKSIPNWGLDTNWASFDNMKRGLSFMGVENVNVVRVPGMMDKDISAGLSADQKAHLQDCLNYANMATAATKWDMCSPGSDTVGSWFQLSPGVVSTDRWTKAIKLCQEFYNHSFWIVEPFNEPDYATWGEGTKQNLLDIMIGLKALPNFAGAAMAGGSTMSTDTAGSWYDAVKTQATVGTTHALYGSTANYVGFIQHVQATGGTPVAPEGHNVVEAIIGAEYGLNTMIWWGTAELARGEFLKASKGKRLGYGADWIQWTAAAVYRSPAGKVQAFLGSSERVGGTTAYTFHSTDRDVYYDGHGPQRDYTVTVRRNQEIVVNITWGPDVPKAISGRYAVVNANSGLCLEVAGGSTVNGALLQQNGYTGTTQQLWDISPLAASNIGDLSYFLLANAKSAMYADLEGWAHGDEASVKQYGYPANAVEHWYFEYAGNGEYYIRSRWSNKYLSISGTSRSLSALLVQRAFTGAADQRWRLQSSDTTVKAVALKINTQPVAVAANPGQPATFSVDAIGTGRLTYQWRFKGAAIDGATEAQWVVNNPQAANAGNYSVVVTDSVGSVTSADAALTVNEPPSITTQPVDTSAISGKSVTFTVAATGTGTFTYQWKKDGVAISGATGATLTLTNISSVDAGVYTVDVTGVAGTVTSTGGSLTVAPPVVVTGHPVSQTAPAAAAVSFSVSATGAGTLTYQWQKDGVAIDGATAATFSLPSIQNSDAGDYTVVITGADGSVTSRLARLTVAVPNPGELTNMSVRSLAGLGGMPLIVGFVVSGDSRDLLVRADGPVLGGAPFYVPGVLSDPNLAVHATVGGADSVPFTNDNWGDNGLEASFSALFGGLGAFALPSGSKDAAVISRIDQTSGGSQTVHVNSTVSGESGVVLLEAFDAKTGGSAHLINVSARNHVGTGGDVLIAGFYISGNVPKKLLVRAVGPGIAVPPFNVPNTLSNPVLNLHTVINNLDTVVATNDNWSDEPGAAAAFAASGAFGLPVDSKDAALVVTLPAGSYTAICSGVGGVTGDAIVEVYEAP